MAMRARVTGFFMLYYSECMETELVTCESICLSIYLHFCLSYSNVRFT